MLSSKEMESRTVFGKRVNGPSPRPVSERTQRFVANSNELAAMARRAGEEDLAQTFEAQGRRMLDIEARFA